MCKKDKIIMSFGKEQFELSSYSIKTEDSFQIYFANTYETIVDVEIVGFSKSIYEIFRNMCNDNLEISNFLTNEKIIVDECFALSVNCESINSINATFKSKKYVKYECV